MSVPPPDPTPSAADAAIPPGASIPPGSPAAPDAPDAADAPVAPFQQRIVVRWQDIDANRHLRNTAYSEFATDTRFRYVAAHGYTQERFEALRFGPVILREEIRYRREVLLGQTVTVNFMAAGLSADGSQWRVRQEVRLPDGKEAAVLTLDGGWLHLDTRRLVEPPADLLAILQRLPHTPDFQEIPSLLRI